MKPLLALFALLLAAQVFSQDVVKTFPESKKGKIVRYQSTHEQRWMEDVLTNTRATLFESDTKDRFTRETYAYTEVRFASTCTFTYTEHRFIAANDRLEHDFDPVTLDLRDLVPEKATITRWSDSHPAPSPLRYTMDGWIVQLASASGKTVRPIVFEGKQTAERFTAKLGGAAKSCGPTASATN